MWQHEASEIIQWNYYDHHGPRTNSHVEDCIYDLNSLLGYNISEFKLGLQISLGQLLASTQAIGYRL